MNTKLKAVIFDMDGLMLDTERLAMSSTRIAGKAIRINFTDEILIEMNGLNESDSNVFLEKKLGRSIDQKKFSEAFYEDYNKAIAENGLLIKKGLIELINCLKENNIKLAVATSTKNDLALKKLKLAGIIDQFEVVIGGDQVVQGKPAPDPYLKAASELGVDVSNCLALEDSDNGAMSAFSAGIRVIVVPDLKQPSSVIKEIALAICNSLLEVKEMILQNFLM
jgi:HAD superfamily hydrolase (TIGR01509 family)